MKKKIQSTYERFTENKQQADILNNEYKVLILSELILATTKEDHISIRKLARESVSRMA